MKKILMIALVVLSFQHIKAQEIYLQAGKNFTKYDFKSINGFDLNLQPGSGDFYEIGYEINLIDEKLKYAIGLNLNEYNAFDDSVGNSYSWNTQYVGIQNALSIAFVNRNGLQVSANAGLGIATLIYGKQNIDGEYFNLTSQKEFTGVWITPKLGLLTSYNVDNDFYLDLGYAYSKGFNVSNSTDEKLSFNNSQIQFGIHYILR